MTLQQVQFQNLQESRRANRVKEAETERSNKAKELETNRSNLASERLKDKDINVRHLDNVATEFGRTSRWFGDKFPSPKDLYHESQDNARALIGAAGKVAGTAVKSLL